MREKLEQIKSSALEAINNASDLKVLEDLRVQYLGKKGELTAVLRGMKDLTAEERPVVGQMANEVREALEVALADKKVGLESEAVILAIFTNSFLCLFSSLV